MIVDVSKVIMAGIGLIRMFKGDDNDTGAEKLIEKELKRMER
ncbi:MAG: hypothetical protein OXD46_06365 [Chloroflexi bacterium]|nr:hypothetical protein [Chloroflexota bacterium]